ncbi:MAG: hypothetical protein GY869_15895 [Planctomycetes bacterium]|nr:hypothetical protein [Planctomycetota bacterium]
MFGIQSYDINHDLAFGLALVNNTTADANNMIIKTHSQFFAVGCGVTLLLSFRGGGAEGCKEGAADGCNGGGGDGLLVGAVGLPWLCLVDAAGNAIAPGAATGELAMFSTWNGPETSVVIVNGLTRFLGSRHVSGQSPPQASAK